MKNPSFDNWLGRLSDKPGLVIFFASALYLTLGCWQGGLNLDAAMYASVARNIAQTGDWLNMSYTDYYFLQFAEHPPLAIWMMALVFKVLGASDTTSRIIGALSALGSIMLVYRIGRELFSPMYGFIASLILMFCVNFVSIGNSALLDGPVTFFMLLSFWGVANPKKFKQRIIISGAALGLAFLCKGLVAVPAYLAVFVYVVVFVRGALTDWRTYLAAVLAVGLPALYAISEHYFGPGYFWAHYFGAQLGEIYEGLRPALSAEWYEFALRFLQLFFPWILLTLVGAYLAIKRRERHLLFVGISLMTMLIVFSFSKYVFNHYFMPLYPLGALLAAYPLVLFLQKRGQDLRRFPAYFLLVWAIVFAGVSISGAPIHFLRQPEVNALSTSANTAMREKSANNGIALGWSSVHWGLVSQIRWYWDSSVKFIGADTTFLAQAISDSSLAYVLVKDGFPLPSRFSDSGSLEPLEKSGSLALYRIVRR